MTPHLRQVGTQLADVTPTPFYLLDLDQIRENYLSFDKIWRERFPNFRAAYSYKTNPLKGVAGMLQHLGASAEVTSGAELEWALEDGFLSDQIFFDGPVKRDDELVTALAAGVRIQLDSLDEVDSIIRLGRRGGPGPRLTARIAVSMNGRGPSRFGMTGPEYVVATGKLNAAGYSLQGLHFHIGSNLTSALGHGAAVQQTIPLLQDLISRRGIPVLLDVGGGFPANGPGRGPVVTQTTDFADAVANALTSGGVRPGDVDVVTEPGRCLVEDAGILITRVVARKTRGGRRLAIVDAGSNLVRSARNWHHAVQFWPPADSGTAAFYELFGALCFESDQLAASVPGPPDLPVGALALIDSAGGYDIPSANVWTRPSPPVLATFGGAVLVLRRKQRCDDVRSLHNAIEF